MAVNKKNVYSLTMLIVIVLFAFPCAYAGHLYNFTITINQLQKNVSLDLSKANEFSQLVPFEVDKNARVWNFSVESATLPARLFSAQIVDGGVVVHLIYLDLETNQVDFENISFKELCLYLDNEDYPVKVLLLEGIANNLRIELFEAMLESLDDKTLQEIEIPFLLNLERMNEIVPMQDIDDLLLKAKKENKISLDFLNVILASQGYIKPTQYRQIQEEVHRNEKLKKFVEDLVNIVSHNEDYKILLEDQDV